MSNIDGMKILKDSQAAKDLLEKAKNQLTVAAKGVVEDIKKGLGDFGK